MQKVCQIATALLLWSYSGMLAKDTICAEMAFRLMERNRPGSIHLRHHLLKGDSLAVALSQDNHSIDITAALIISSADTCSAVVCWPRTEMAVMLMEWNRPGSTIDCLKHV